MRRGATTIHKYAVPITDSFVIRMPRHAELLTVQVQRGTPCLWARVNPDDPIEGRKFRVFGTGHELPSLSTWNGQYVGTFLSADGDLVWHLYEDRDD